MKRKNKVRPQSPGAKLEKKKILRSTQWMLFLLCFAERVGVEMIKGCQEFLLTGFLAVQMERGSKVSPQDKKK